MFVDASVFMAIFKEEPEGRELADRVEQSAGTMTSPIAIVETVISLGRHKGLAASIAYSQVLRFLSHARIEIRPVDATTGELAVLAHGAYGKGTGHPARLNLGDCFAYAVAKQYRVPLLYKGDDFARTDLA